MPVGYIYIVDDDQAVRASLSALFEANGYGSRRFSSAQEFLVAAPALDPGCLIADIRMPGMDGLEMQRRLIELGLPFPFIVITGHGDVPLAVGAMKAGALDFIEKPFAPDTILNRTKNALGNLSTRPQPDALSATAASRLKSLSPREREVLEALLLGLSNKSIGYELGISPRTVEIHRARVMEKTGAHSLSELVRLGLAAGLQPRFEADRR
ncbi:MAG: response regulator [Alphaproteobacteria bacterium]|jgi:two-component system response regulator FixJ|nr:MAG: DNA-binding response regulator [Betaproteobacteria bacterium 13_1_20CM_3_63_8]TMJ77893.1 MAG: response regulator [Alphaproteobacteria bacterium]TMK11864.1 MAG: response regulator [Alphaproteobacteria bacterium]TMK30082.1 MAG: response regulator [Alphaproteobacteria bacterium]